MGEGTDRAVAVVGVGAIMPDAPDAATFWENIKNGRYSISDVDPARWDPELYYDPDPKAPDKTYSKIGGWVRNWDWDPRAWKLAVMPRVADAMDDAQKWAVACTHQVLTDYGYPDRSLDNERVAVVFGNAMAGEKHYQTSLRISFPEIADELGEAPGFRALPNDIQQAITTELHDTVGKRYPEITEDTMPGELSNCIAGRVANLFNFRGPNYVIDAACASAMAAISSAVEGLVEGDYDAVISGGIDRNMGASTYVKFCKIGALSATGTRPYADGADGFVMGEGAAVFLLKRLDDAIAAGDRIYCVLLGLAGSSDGKGKGITAPNPVGQRLCVERAWRNAGLAPQTATLVEGHGTSTRVGDVVEHESMASVFGDGGVAPGSIPLGSVKSNIGHLKGAAGAAGLFKAVMSLHEKVLPPSLNFSRPNPDIDFSKSPFRVNTELREWERPETGVRRAGVSAFGFGGTNFHTVLEEYVPRSGDGGAKPFPVPEVKASPVTPEAPPSAPRGAAVVGAATETELRERLASLASDAGQGRVPPPEPPSPEALRAPERVAIDFSTADELADKVTLAEKAFTGDDGAWKLLRSRGIFRGRGPASKVAFLYTGQGSQYPNMLRKLVQTEPVAAEVFDEADRVMAPLLEGRRLRDYLFVDPDDEAAVARAEEELRRTEITQPAVLAVDYALTRLLDERGLRPDLVMGHSLGEYGALVAAGALPLADALEAVSARGREMANLDVEDRGLMAAVFAPLAEVQDIVGSIDGNVVVANINSTSQAVIGGASAAVEQAIAAVTAAGHQVARLPVSHAFHTSIVAPASEPLKRALARLRLRPPAIPVVANVSGELYPMGEGAEAEMIDILGRQVASPVQFVKGLRTLHEHGARVFVEVGPKKALHGFVEEVFADEPDVVALFTNHPKWEDDVAFNQARCGLYAAGTGSGAAAAASGDTSVAIEPPSPSALSAPATTLVPPERYSELGQLVAEFLDRTVADGDGVGLRKPVVVSGAALGVPGTERVFDRANLARLLRGEQCIKTIPPQMRDAILDQHITRLVKRPDGSGSFETIDDAADVIKLAARAQAFDPAEEFGIDPERVPALENATCMAIAAGFDALRDAGIPLVMHYKETHIGTRLPERWGLPGELRDDTGVIFAAAFPGLDAFAGHARDYYTDKARREQLAALEAVRASVSSTDGTGVAAATAELDRRIAALRAEIEANPYVFDRRFLFRVLSMGHSQFAEIIGARGPNTQVNAACASTTQAIAVAEDWIRTRRCRRVIVIAADDVTSDNLLGWIGSGFLASGAAATDEVVEEAATPFDRRRHGMILGMGAAALVLEAAEAAEERGVRPIAEVLSALTANSAFHGTRLDVEHISAAMEALVSQAENRWGIDRQEVGPSTVFVSHETYTPARGGSAAAEVASLRAVFGPTARDIVVANTKGLTGHPMGAGIEDVVAVKSLETGLVPPIANFKEPDAELGELNLSRGGSYPVGYALRLAAGFGSQISMALLRWVPTPDRARRGPEELGYEYRIDDQARWRDWLARVSGNAEPSLEVVQHQLRVVDTGPAPPTTVEATAPVREAPAELAPVDAPALAEPVPGTAPSTPAAAPAGSAVVAPAAEAPPAPEEVEERVLALVAEKTGYPRDMLDLDLDLEADLGIDTVKQAELFATVREAYGIPRDDKLKLRDFPTLDHVIRFVVDRSGGSGETAPVQEEKAVPAREPAPAPEAEPAPAPHSVAEDEVRERVLALVAEKTGYPQDMLDLDLDLEADLGIDTVKQAELFATVREAYGIPRDDSLKLRDFPTLDHVIRFVVDRSAGGDEPAPVQHEETAPPRQREPAPAPPPEAGRADEDEVRKRVLALVAEKTGYPQDMLDLDLDLEADLGIDTVKQAELFATVREAYGIPRDESLKLRDFPTLDHVIRFVVDRAAGAGEPAPARQAEAVAEPAREAAPAPRAESTAGLEACDAVPRRVPVPVLRPPLDLCRPTGVDLGAGSRVVVMPDRDSVATALVDLLGQRGVEPLVIEGAPDAEALAEQLEAWVRAGAVHGVYWLPALDVEPPLAELDLSGWREGLRLRVKLLATTMRVLYEQVAPAGTFLLAASRMGGRHGYEDAGARAPLGGAVTGFTKAYKRERPDTLVKAVDVQTDAGPEQVAAALVEETLHDPDAVEIGRDDGLRWAVGLEEQAVDDGQRGLTLGPDAVFVVTGAAGSIVSAVVADLAAASGGTFHLLDLVPEPNPADPDLERFVTDRDGLKRDLIQRLKDRGERATPALVERELAKLERGRAALDAMLAIRDAGGEAAYHSLDLRDPDAVAKAMQVVRERHGRVDVLLHAAGLDASHLLADKPDEEYALVFDVKSDGWFNLLTAIGDMPLAATVCFSSVAARFGNGGQTDYSAANDLLCKTTSSFRTTRPSTRGIAIDWTAWGGIGMATRGSIPKMMERAGIEMLAPDAGVPWVRRELVGGGRRGEVLVATGLGILVDEVDLEATRTTFDRPAGPMGGAVTSTGVWRPFTVETTLDPAAQPFLEDHRIDGVPVLPGVMGIEAFAEAAALAAPGWRVVSVEDVAFLAPFKFYRDEARQVVVETTVTPSGDGQLLASCRLLGSRTLPNQAAPQVTTHFTGRVRLSQVVPPASQASSPGSPHGGAVGADSIYRVYFHGPAYRVLERSWRKGDDQIGLLADALPANHQPPELPLVTAPRLLELCFQTAGLWEMGTSGRLALPQQLARVVLPPREDATGRLHAIVVPRDGGEQFDAEVVDDAGRAHLRMEGYRTVALPGQIDAGLLEPMRIAVS